MLNPDANLGKEGKWEELKKKLSERDAKLPMSNEFKKVKASDKVDDLIQVCKEIYKRKSTSVSDNKTLYKDTWRHCSIFGWSPHVVKDEIANGSDYRGKWGKEGKNEHYLLYTTFFGGESDIWRHIFNNVLKVDLLNPSRVSKIDGRFKKLTSSGDLMKTCHAAYKTDSKIDGDVYGKTVIEYCLLDRSATVTKYPTAPST